MLKGGQFMSINAIGFNNGYCSSVSSLSEETRRKLLALGIDPSAVMSEAQAQMLIAQLQSSQKINQTIEISSVNNNLGEQELISRAKNLAGKIGVSIPQGTPLGEILQILGAKIDALTAECENDENKITKVKSYQNELSDLISQFTLVQQNENAMFASMNYNADMNKMMLGL